MPACHYNQMPVQEFENGRTYRCSMSVADLRETYRREDEADAKASAAAPGEDSVRLTKGV